MNRVEQIHADEYIKSLERDLRELKNRQIAGASSIRIKVTQSSSVSISTGGSRIVTFTAASGKNQFGELRYRVYQSGSPVSDKAYGSQLDVFEQRVTPDQKTKKWLVKQNAGSGTYSVIFYVASNTGGTISVA